MYPLKNLLFTIITVRFILDILGLYSCIILITCLTTFLLALLTTLYFNNFSPANIWLDSILNTRLPTLPRGISCITSDLRRGSHTFSKHETNQTTTAQLETTRAEEDVQEYTGIKVIDTQLHPIVCLLFRDYIKCWYAQISTDEQFLADTHTCLREFVHHLSQSVCACDLVSYVVSGRCIDDVTAHVRLYRLARTASQLSRRPIHEVLFEMECEHSAKHFDRSKLCLQDDYFRQYLRDVTRVILYKFLDRKDFTCHIAQTIIVEIVSQKVLYAAFEFLADVDNINRMIVSFITDKFRIAPAHISYSLRFSRCVEELQATKQALVCQLSRCQLSHGVGTARASRPGDTGRAHAGLYELMALIEARLKSSSDSRTHTCTLTPARSHISLTEVLDSNVGLSYLLDYLSRQHAQNWLFCHLNIEEWKTTLARVGTDCDPSSVGVTSSGTSNMFKIAHHSAVSIYQQFLHADSQNRLELNAELVEEVRNSLAGDQLHITCFDRVHMEVLQHISAYFHQGFQQTVTFKRLLAELDVSEPSLSPGENSPTRGDLEDAGADATGDTVPSDTELDSLRRLDMSIDIDTVGTARAHTLYLVTTSLLMVDGTHREWSVRRRYSHFLDLRDAIVSRYPSLSCVQFPGKRAFNNQSSQFVERRRNALVTFVKTLIRPERLSMYSELAPLILRFARDGADGVSTRTQERVSLETVLLAPLRHTASVFGDTVQRSLRHSSQSWPRCQQDALSATTDLDADESVLRVVLQLIAEVFDFESRHQWLRKQALALLRQIICTLYERSLSRRLADCVDELVRPQQLAAALKRLREYLWPSRTSADEQTRARDADTCARTRVVARAALYALMTDEMRHLIGVQTSQEGVAMLFDILQNRALNRRLQVVLFEHLLELLLPDYDMCRFVQPYYCRTSI